MDITSGEVEALLSRSHDPCHEENDRLRQVIRDHLVTCTGDPTGLLAETAGDGPQTVSRAPSEGERE